MKVQDARCRACREKGLEVFLDLGAKPPSDRILTKEMLKFYQYQETWQILWILKHMKLLI